MVIWSKLEASCPICRSRLPLREVGSGFVLGQDSDLLVRMDGQHVIQADIHTCRKCRFSGYPNDFLLTISKPEKARFTAISATLLAEELDLPTHAAGSRRGAAGTKRNLLSDVQYFWSFRTAEALGFSATEQGLRLARAYWCTRLAPTKSLEANELKRRRKMYLKIAIQKLRQGLRFEKDTNLLYLIGELCRRSSNFLLAESYFRRFQEQANAPTYLLQAAQKLSAFSRNKNASHATMEGLLYGKKTRQKSEDRDRE